MELLANNAIQAARNALQKLYAQLAIKDFGLIKLLAAH